jgi:hypothetical protein
LLLAEGKHGKEKYDPCKYKEFNYHITFSPIHNKQDSIELIGTIIMSKMSLKLKKQKKREQVNQRQRRFVEKKRLELKRRRTYAQIFPKFHFDTENGDPEFVQAVKDALKTINFEDRTVFQDWETELYRMLKREGAGAVWTEFCSIKLDCHETGNQIGKVLDLYFLCNLGQTVFDRIPQIQRERHLPFNDFRFDFKGNYISCVFRSLRRAKGPGGTIYYSRHRPTLLIDGEPKVIGFSRHAIQRICERIKPRWKLSYGALGDVFAFFDQCRYFEACKLHEGQLAFTFFDECAVGYWSYLYVLGVLGEDNLDSKQGRPYYRVGYCPTVIDKDFIIAKTFLLPGHAQTPEYTAVCQSPLFNMRRSNLLEEMRKQEAGFAAGAQDFSLAKIFHDVGVPQVVQLSGRIYGPAV